MPILQLPICAIPVGTWMPKIGETNRRPLATLRPNASLTSALNLLVQGLILFLFLHTIKSAEKKNKEMIILFYFELLGRWIWKRSVDSHFEKKCCFGV